MALPKTVPNKPREFVVREEADPTVPRAHGAQLAGRYAYGVPEAVTRVVADATVADTVSKSLPRPASGPRAAARVRCNATAQLAYRGVADLHVGLLEDASGAEQAVAVKRLDGVFAESGAALPRACPDAWLGCHLDHPNLLRTHALVAEDAATWCAFEYPAAETLAGLMRDGARPPVRIVVAIIQDVLRALEAARRAVDPVAGGLEIVHGGITPESVLVAEDGVTRLIQFGLARRLDPGQRGPFGRPGYAAPEQVFDQRSDASSDVFNAGILLWEALTGRRLLEGESAVEATLKFLASGAPAPSSLNPRVLLSLDSVVQRALEPTPERRFTSAHEFAAALTQAVGPATAREVAHYVQGLGWAALERHRSLMLDLHSGRLPLRNQSRPFPAKEPRSAIYGIELDGAAEPARQASTSARAELLSARDEHTRVDGIVRAPLSPDLADAVGEGDADGGSRTVFERAWAEPSSPRHEAPALALPALPTVPPQRERDAAGRAVSPFASTVRRTAPQPIHPRRRRTSRLLLLTSLFAVFAGAYGAGRVLRAHDVELDWRRWLGGEAQVGSTAATPSAPAPAASAAPPALRVASSSAANTASAAPLQPSASPSASALPVLSLDDLPLAEPAKTTRSRGVRSR